MAEICTFTPGMHGRERYMLRIGTLAARIAKFHVPYWVGVRGNGECARIVVLDGLRRRVEGARVKNILRDWLTAMHEA